MRVSIASRYGGLVLIGLTPLPLAALDDAPRFTHETIDAKPPDRPYYKMVGDIDGDGDLDIIVGGAKGPLVWYSNPDWKKTEIAKGGWDGVNGEVADVDGDGDADIVMGGVVWFSNPRVGGGSWAMTKIDSRRAHDIEVGDLNRDGRLDVVARDQSAFGKAGNAIYVYYQIDPQTWRKVQWECPHGEGLKVSDIDSDGDLDIVIGGIWFENNPSENANGWIKRVFTRAWTEPDAKVDVADINGDGRPDVVVAPAELRGETYKVAWYEAPADRRTDDWREHVIASSIECLIHALGTGDFDGDGSIDVAIAEMHQGADPDEVSVLYNADKGNSWRKQVIAIGGSHDIVVADMDNDGDSDIVGANHSDVHPIELWRNERSAVLLKCDFERDDWWRDWGARSQPQNTEHVSGEAAFGGRGRSLKVTVPRGQHMGTTFSYKFRERLGSEPDAIYFRYYLKFDPNWSHATSGGKLPGISGTYGRAGWGGRRVNGSDGWSARGLFNSKHGGDSTAIGFYCYHTEMRGQYGSHFEFTPRLEHGRWYGIELYTKLNTLGAPGARGNNDGVLHGWIDGEPAFEKTDLRFRDVDSLKIEDIWVNVYHGGATPVPKADISLYLDNMVISRTPIGPIETQP